MPGPKSCVTMVMYAVLVTGGKQYRVMQGETIRVQDAAKSRIGSGNFRLVAQLHRPRRRVLDDPESQDPSLALVHNRQEGV